MVAHRVGDSCFVKNVEGKFYSLAAEKHRCYSLWHGKVLKAVRIVGEH